MGYGLALIGSKWYKDAGFHKKGKEISGFIREGNSLTS
jgi:hypothetical protein